MDSRERLAGRPAGWPAGRPTGRPACWPSPPPRIKFGSESPSPVDKDDYTPENHLSRYFQGGEYLFLGGGGYSLMRKATMMLSSSLIAWNLIEERRHQGQLHA